MRLSLLASAAATALAVSVAATQAQQPRDTGADRAPAASQPATPGSNEVERDRNQGQSMQRSSPRDSRTNADRERGRSTTGAGAQDAQPQGRASGEKAQDRPPAARSQAQESEAERSRDAGQARERASDRQRQQTRERATDKPRQQTRERTEPSRARTEQRRERGPAGQADRQRDRATTGQATQERSPERSRADDTVRSRQDRRDRAVTGQESERRGEVRLTGEQRTRVSATFTQRIERMNVQPLSRTNISVSIGAVVPRSVRVYSVPQDVIAIYPRFRGHRFVVVEEEIVIIEPSSRRIVAVLPYGGERRAGRVTTGRAAAGAGIRLEPEQRRLIRTIVLREPVCRFEQRIDFFIGIPLPRTVEVCSFPEEVLTEVPAVRDYRFVVRGEEVVIVDPDGYRVVEVID